MSDRPDKYCVTTPDGDCISEDTRCMHQPKTPFELFGAECGEGWQSLIKPIIEACEDTGASVFQIKEKFGGLRIYLDNAPGWLNNMCYIVEILSAYTCEECGAEGKVRGDGWIKTLCDNCANKERT